MEAFTPILLEIKVFLEGKSITKPITQIIDKGRLNEFSHEAQILSYFDATKLNFTGLFSLLSLKKLSETLIKLPTKKSLQIQETTIKHENKPSVAKIDIKNPYQKLPKQANLLNFAKKNENSHNFENSLIFAQNYEKKPLDENSKDFYPEKPQISDFCQNYDKTPLEENSMDFYPEKPQISDFYDKKPLDENSMDFQPKKPQISDFCQNYDKKPLAENPKDFAPEKPQISEICEETNDTLDIDYENLFKIDNSCENLQFYEPPASFKSSLHPYQKQALAWMLKREGICLDSEKNPCFSSRTLHPLWEQYLLKDGSHLFFNPYSGQISVETPLSNINCKGGILADEMGLGKTVMMISLLHANPWGKNQDNSKENQLISSRISTSEKSEKSEKNEKNEKNAKNDKNAKNEKIALFSSRKALEFSTSETRPQISLENPLTHHNRDFFPAKPKFAGTLIIVPLTLLSQWESELVLHSSPSHFRTLLYYGDTRPLDLHNYDIVITTYGIVSCEYSLQNPSIFSYSWFRIVLDEAHYIKGRTIQLAKAVYHIRAQSRWCMTGTPIQNKLDDLFSLLHFLRLEPWSDYLWWNSYINKPYEKKDPLVFTILRSIISPILLRRTKKGKTKDGRSIIDLPEKDCYIEYIDFSREEESLYKEVYMKSKKEFDDLLSKGTFLSNYMHVFDILMRLRQICDHPYLMLTRSDYANKDKLEETVRRFVEKRLKAQKITENNKENAHFEVIFDEISHAEIVVNINAKNSHGFNEKYFEEIVRKLRRNEIENCPVCLGDLEDAVITLCLHVTCRLCMVRALESSGMCPLCRKMLNKEDFMTVPRENKFEIDLDSKYKRSSKMEKLMEKIADLLKKDEKAVIFSQFLGMLDLIEYDFKRNNIKYLRFDGSLPHKKRGEILRNFKEDSTIPIIMISLKAGGVGLNLVEANHVFLIDPWWNPAVEEQAVERVHRIGQKRKVEVVRFICRGSIEERMIELHKKKKDLFNSAINAENSEKKGENNGKIDKKLQNIEYFKYLMSHY